MTSRGENVATSTPTTRSKPSTTASCTPITVDDDESPANNAAENVPIPDPDILPITSRHTSSVWSDFKRKRVGEDVKAQCNHCLKLLAGGPKAGTTHLKDHTKACPKRVCQDVRQTRLFGTKHNVQDKSDSLTLAPYEFRQEDGRKDLAEMIILHEYPISMVEHHGFRKYSRTLQPGFKVPCRTTTRKDIMQRYENEKENIATLLRKSKGRIALTTDMWTASNQRKGYMAVTSHFIDNNWKLQSRIIRFLYVPAPHTAEVLADALRQCVQSWNLDLRLSAITVDNCTTNDAMMEMMKGDILMHEFAQFLEKDRSQTSDKSDLDKYLEDDNIPLLDEFDILNWWKTNGGTYPVLQQIARDILSIPVSTVPSESAFSTSGRVLDPYRSRLLPEAVEALMCSQNWIWASIKNSGEVKEDEFATIVGELEEECDAPELRSDDIFDDE